MPLIHYTPQDTLFFRDGRPFDKEESSSTVPSLFPPSPQTLVGAARALWAGQMGWDSRRERRWPSRICEVLGDGEELANLAFAGPLLLKDGRPYFPAPANLVGKKASPDQGDKTPQQLKLLQPSKTPCQCDLGAAVRLPVISSPDDIHNRRQLEQWWLDSDGLQALLAGKLPEPKHFLHQSSLWREEARTGITINPATGSTEESALYMTTHIRMAKGAALAMQINRLPLPPSAASQVNLGGEARSAWLEIHDQSAALPQSPSQFYTHGDTLNYSFTVLTPMAVDAAPTPGGRIEGVTAGNKVALPGVVVSACLPRVQRWGGWDSVERKPLPLKPYLAPGSVVFMEAHVNDAEQLKSLHGTPFGLRSNWGFGLIVIGTWS